MLLWVSKLVRLFLSTPSARRATALVLADVAVKGISIHALREEGDAEYLGTANITIQFLSTPSARRATDVRLCIYHLQV